MATAPAGCGARQTARQTAWRRAARDRRLCRPGPAGIMGEDYGRWRSGVMEGGMGRRSGDYGRGLWEMAEWGDGRRDGRVG